MSWARRGPQVGGNRRDRQRRGAMRPGQLEWAVMTAQAFGWPSKSQAQQDLQLDMAGSFRAMEETAFPPGQGDELNALDPKGGRHWQRYVANVKGFERLQPPRKGPLLGMLRDSAQAYLDHFDNDYSAREKRSQTNQTKRDACLKTLADLRKYDVRDEFAALGDPPWNTEIAMKAASLKAGLDLESVPGGQMEKLGGDGANPAFWVNRSGDNGTAKTSLFKPEVSGRPDIGGMPPGCETAREALAGRTSDVLTTMTGIDFGMPETHVISLGKDKFPEGTLTGTPFANGNGPVLGSLQQFAPTDGELRDKSAHVMRAIPPESCQTLTVLDTISLNMDRHSGNLLVKSTGGAPEVVPIDHGLTFPTTDALKELPNQFGNDKNVLLKLPGSYEPFSQDMLQKIDRIDPDLLASSLRGEIETLEGAHPQTAGKVGEDSVQISRRAAMFLKQAAATLPPAVLQVALGQNATELLDPAIDDQEFARRAAQVIQDAGNQADAIKEYFLMMSDEERVAMRTALSDNGWPQANGQLNERWMMSDLKTALKLYRNDVRNPTMLAAAKRMIGEQRIDELMQQPGVSFYQVYNQVVAREERAQERPLELDENSADEARKLLAEFPKTSAPLQPQSEKDIKDLRTALSQWREYLQLGGSGALDEAIETLRLPETDIAVQRNQVLDALIAMRQAEALRSMPRLDDDPDDTQAKLKSLDYVEKIVARLPQQEQGPFQERISQLRLSVSTDGAMLRRITDVKERHKDAIATLKADAFDAARTGLSQALDDLVRTLRGPKRVTEDEYRDSVTSIRAQLRAGNVVSASDGIERLKRTYGVQ